MHIIVPIKFLKHIFNYVCLVLLNFRGGYQIEVSFILHQILDVQSFIFCIRGGGGGGRHTSRGRAAPSYPIIGSV